jgi:hypothetical protein
MKIAMLGLFLSLFPFIATAQSSPLFQAHPAVTEQVAFADQVDRMVLGLDQREQKIIAKIRKAIQNADAKQISYLMSLRVYTGLRDTAQKAFWAEVLYIAFSYSYQMSCMSRSFWFLSDGKQKLFVKQTACEKQVDQNLIVGGVSSSATRQSIAQDYCSIFNKTWPTFQDAAIAYNKGHGNPPYVCH